MFQHYHELEALHVAALDHPTTDAILGRIMQSDADLISAPECRRVVHAAVFGRPQPATAE